MIDDEMRFGKEDFQDTTGMLLFIDSFSVKLPTFVIITTPAKIVQTPFPMKSIGLLIALWFPD